MGFLQMVKIVDVCGDGEMDNTRKTAASKIFDTARDLFYRRGIRAVGVDEIVCEAGVTKPSLYRAFKSKDDLVAACLRESAKERREAVMAALAAAGDDPLDQLRGLVSHYAGKLRCPEYRGCPVSNVAVELPEPDHPGRIIIEDCKNDLRALVVRSARERSGSIGGRHHPVHRRRDRDASCLRKPGTGAIAGRDLRHADRRTRQTQGSRTPRSASRSGLVIGKYRSLQIDRRQA
jgi:AcrR family transcriptional regulator